MQIIDPHIHLFDLKLGQYQWLSAENPPHWPDKAVICKDFSERDLHLSQDLELAAFIHIEAGFDNAEPSNEIDWLERSCSKPFRTIPFADLTLSTAAFAQQLERLKTYNSVVGIRHILDDQATTLLSSPQCLCNLTQIANNQLLFECQLDLSDNQATKQLIRATETVPHLTWVINHAGFPPNQQPLQTTDWYANLNQLASCPAVVLKCSGWEMTERQYQSDWLIQVLKHTLSAFGRQRVMLASNFPLCLLSKSYQQYWQTIIELTKQCIEGDHTALIQALCYDNAKHYYRL